MVKSLKQIREHHDSRFVPKQVMLEASTVVPSSKEMPPIILFRRITYKVYPNKQVIALYYARGIDKYLSVPFGPGGNLNLTEAKIIDIEEEQDFIPEQYPTSQESFHSKLNELRKERINEDWKDYMPKGEFGKKLQSLKNMGKVLPGSGDMQTSREKFKKGDYSGAAKDFVKGGLKGAATGAAAAIAGRALSGAMGAGAGGALASKAIDKAKEVVTGGGNPTPEAAPKPLKQAPITKIKTNSSRKVSKPAASAVFQSKLRAHDNVLANQPKQKIQELRQIVKENVQKDLMINGKPITINTGMAKRILEVYDNVNTKNKKIVESMLNSDLESFKRLLNFSVKA